MNYEEQIDYGNTRNVFMIYNHMRITEVGPGTATAVADITQDSLNTRGMVHGGVFYTLADCTVVAAARSDDRRYVTLSSSFEYLRAAKEGPLTCVATAVKLGRTTSVFRAEISGADQRLLAVGTFTVYCVEE